MYKQDPPIPNAVADILNGQIASLGVNRFTVSGGASGIMNRLKEAFGFGDRSSF